MNYKTASTKAAEPDLYQTLLLSYDCSKRAWGMLTTVRSLSAIAARRSQNFSLQTSADDVRATMDTIDEFNLAMFNSAASDLTDEQLLAIGRKVLRQARIMAGCLRHDPNLAEYTKELGHAHELLRDAYGPLSAIR